LILDQKRFVRWTGCNSVASQPIKFVFLGKSSYSEAWAMTYFLLRTKEQEYIAFLITLSDGKPLDTRDARERIELFEKSDRNRLGDA